MKFLLCLCCLSSVWIIALTGCSAKHYENMPLGEQNPIRFQAKADAESDAKDDVDVLAYFGKGMSATFAAAMCGLMTGFHCRLDPWIWAGQSFLHDWFHECCGGLKPADSILYPSPRIRHLRD